MQDEIRQTSPAASAGRGAQDAGERVYERVVPALPASVTRLRRELDDVLARLAVDASRRGDIALAVTEATTNAVMHAYCDREPGPLAVSAYHAAGTLLVTVSDQGCGPHEHSDSPGLGVGVGLMRRLADSLRVAANDPEGGTRVSLLFRHAVPQAGAAPVTAFARRAAAPDAAALRGYAAALAESSAAACEDTRALLAQARQTLARANELRLERARLTDGAAARRASSRRSAHGS